MGGRGGRLCLLGRCSGGDGGLVVVFIASCSETAVELRTKAALILRGLRLARMARLAKLMRMPLLQAGRVLAYFAKLLATAP